MQLQFLSIISQKETVKVKLQFYCGGLQFNDKYKNIGLN